MDSIFERVKSAVSITDVVERVGGLKLNYSRMACCPFHEEKTPSFSVKESEGMWKCFGCGASGDAVDFVAKLKGIEPIEAAKLLAEMYGVSEPSWQGNRKSDARPKRAEPVRRDGNVAPKKGVKEYIQNCEKNIGGTDYFSKRGLTEETIKRFHLGFDAEKQCVVIPYSSRLDYYQTRSVVGKEFRKPKTEDAGAEPLWNMNALIANGAVFVVESPICAMSIIQCCGQAVSLCGATGGQKLLTLLKGKKPKCTFVLSLDNDEPGQKAQQDLANELHEMNIKFIHFNVAGECKDPNELLMKDTRTLAANVKEATLTVRRQFSKLKTLFNAAELQGREIKPIRWIVHDLLPEGLAIVCAPSKYGKSWLMMQLCLAVTKGLPFFERKTEQCDCVYFALEDSERRFKSRLNLLTKGTKAPSNFYGSVHCDTMTNGLFEQLTELMETNPKNRAHYH